MAFLDSHAAFTRRGHGGSVQADTDGLVAAAFCHRTSRALDPQLHTHVLVANKVRASTDGAWLSVDGRALFEVQKAAGLLYKAGLRAELTARLGVAWGEVNTDGGAEIAGVPSGLVEGFSKRRREVEAEAIVMVAGREASLGRSLTGDELAAVYQQAAYQSRAGKEEGGYSTAELRARWRAEAAEAGAQVEEWLGRVLDARQASAFRQTAARAGLGAALAEIETKAVAILESKWSTWGRAQVIETLSTLVDPAMAATAGAAGELIEQWADRLLARQEMVVLNPPVTADASPTVLCRRDGLDPTLRHSGLRYSTLSTLRAEQTILEITEEGRSAGVAVVPAGAVGEAIGEGGLSDDQANAVERLCRGGERIAVLVGPAGSGKSRTLGAARAAWQAAGTPIRGLAPSAVAAGVLSEQAGIASDTVAKFLHDAARGRDRLQAGQVVVCDEASMISTRDLAQLVDHVWRTDAKLVLVGDHLQLGSVEAGGLFRILAADAKTAELETIWRFNQPWEGPASSRLRQRDTTVLHEYQQRERINSGTRTAMIDQAHQAWLDAQHAGQTAVMMAADHDTVDRLAMRARATRVAAGQVEPGGILLGEQIIGVGDHVVTTRNDRRLITTTGAWIRNGDRWQVQARHHDHLVLSSLDGRGRVTIPAAYTNQHVALAYAVTVHKAQGLTVDQAVMLVDAATSGEHLYVGLTRGRDQNNAYVITEDTAEPGTSPDPLDVLARALGRTSSQLSATETIRSELDRQLDAALLAAAIEEGRRRIDAEAGADRTAEIRRLQPIKQRHDILHAELAAAQDRLQQLHSERTKAEADLATARQQYEAAGERRGLLRKPDRQAQAAATSTVTALEAHQQRLDDQTHSSSANRDRLLQDIAELRSDIDRLEEAEKAQAARTHWLAGHPEVAARIGNLQTEVDQLALDVRARHRSLNPATPSGTNLVRPLVPAAPAAAQEAQQLRPEL